jgi:hypothetical protein
MRSIFGFEKVDVIAELRMRVAKLFNLRQGVRLEGGPVLRVPLTRKSVSEAISQVAQRPCSRPGLALCSERT